MSLMKWKKHNDPIKDFFEDDDFFTWSLLPVAKKRLAGLQDFWAPAVDIKEDDKSVTVTADLPGLKKEDITVDLHDNILTIRGERKFEDEEKKKDYHRVERSYGVFERRVDLGASVDGTKIDASYKNGVLKISAPKTQSAPLNKIEIKD